MLATWENTLYYLWSEPSLCTAAPPLKKIGSDFFEGRGGCTQASPNPSGNAAILFVPFGKEVLQHIVFTKYEWCNIPLITSEIYSWYFHHSEFDILDNKSPSENSSPSIDPSENPPGRKSLNDPSIGGGEGGCIMQWPWTQQISLAGGTVLSSSLWSSVAQWPGAPNDDIVQNHLT